MFEPVVHPETASQIQRFLRRPTHALLISGPTGIGKKSLMSSIAASLLDVDAKQFTHYPYQRIIEPIERKQIPIESIRELEHFISLIIPGSKPLKRIIQIRQAEMMTVEAQNALLKTLEEPPSDTVLLLGTNNLEGLLPTIRSRVHELTITRPARQAIYDHFSSAGYTQSTISSSYVMSGGLPGLMSALLSDNDHPLSQATELARKVLGTTTFGRLAMVDALAKKKLLVQDLVLILAQMSSLRLLDERGSASKARWLNILKASYAASENLASNAQTKLTLMNLMLQIS